MKKLTFLHATAIFNEQTLVLVEMSDEPQSLEQTVPNNTSYSPISSISTAICDTPIATCDPPEATCDPPELQELYDTPEPILVQPTTPEPIPVHPTKKILSAKQLLALERGRKKLAEKRRLLKETVRNQLKNGIPETIHEESDEEDTYNQETHIVRYGIMNWVSCTIV